MPKFNGGDPVNFINLHYSGVNAITQAEMRSYDERLYNSIRGFCNRYGKKLREFVPPKQKMRTHEEVMESRKSLKIELNGKYYDFSEGNPTKEELNTIIATLMGIRERGE